MPLAQAELNVRKAGGQSTRAAAGQQCRRVRSLLCGHTATSSRGDLQSGLRPSYLAARLPSQRHPAASGSLDCQLLKEPVVAATGACGLSCLIAPEHALITHSCGSCKGCPVTRAHEHLPADTKSIFKTSQQCAYAKFPCATCLPL